MAKRLYKKKSLGQHFLNDDQIAFDIANALGTAKEEGFDAVIEIGPGQGALTRHIFELQEKPIYLNELDDRLIAELQMNFPQNSGIIHKSFLDLDFNIIQENQVAIIGNFPYNISSQIVFKALENYERVPILTGMFQKEMAARICADHGSKTYGVISVLSQLIYEAEYLFDVGPECFNPPPRVVSGVIRLRRLPAPKAPIKMVKKLVKTAFATRRKKLRNNLKGLITEKELLLDPIFDKRAEQISVEEYINLAKRFKEYL